jgi:putative transposase
MVKTFHRKPLRPSVCIVSGFFITAKGRLFVPLAKRNDYFDLVLNIYAREALRGKELRSLTIASGIVSICYAIDVKPKLVKTVYGVDRNEKNLTLGDKKDVVQIDMSQMVKNGQTAREIVGSFKRNDFRIRRRIASKYWRRAGNKNKQMLHAVANFAIELATRNGAALALEDLTGIRKMYRRNNGQSSDYRFRMNSWPYGKVYQILSYKCKWNGLTLIPLTIAETNKSSSVHCRSGESLHVPSGDDSVRRRLLWCQHCEVWVDRDANAALNLSTRGLSRFDSSLPWDMGSEPRNPKEEGLASEAMRGNGTMIPILRVDASKLLMGRPRAS